MSVALHEEKKEKIIRYDSAYLRRIQKECLI